MTEKHRPIPADDDRCPLCGGLPGDCPPACDAEWARRIAGDDHDTDDALGLRPGRGTY